jgi:hypothetical protein
MIGSGGRSGRVTGSDVFLSMLHTKYEQPAPFLNISITSIASIRGASWLFGGHIELQNTALRIYHVEKHILPLKESEEKREGYPRIQRNGARLFLICGGEEVVVSVNIGIAPSAQDELDHVPQDRRQSTIFNPFVESLRTMR